MRIGVIKPDTNGLNHQSTPGARYTQIVNGNSAANNYWQKERSI